MRSTSVFACILASVVVALTPAIGPVVGAAHAAPAHPSAVVGSTDLGPNVYLFTPSMSQVSIQTTLTSVANEQVGNQFGNQRYALLFEPGTYGSPAAPLVFQVGYYTDVMGLGQNPGDVVINGSINVYNQCDSGSCTALNNFWRSVSNLTINVTNASGAGCYAGEFWATSQGTSMRRVQVQANSNNMTFMDYCTGPSYASGGFVADSAFSGGTEVNGSQQQYLLRNSKLSSGTWSNGVWNQVFVGTPGAPAEHFTSTNPYTTVTQTPVEREKPYLYLDSSGRLDVFVPSAQTGTAGTSWSASTNTPGTSLPISSFFVASPSSTVTTMNAALASGQNLLLTPGVYQLPSAINVTNANTVVLGLGLATLQPTNGNAAMTVAGVAGVDLADIIFDAGPVSSPALLDMAASLPGADAGQPSAVQDVYFRVGGAEAGKVDTAFELDTSNVVLDNIWAWRADHGTGVGWTQNTATTGLQVLGSNVTAYGLFVEHFQGDEIVWNGANGAVYMLQNEMPYDPPTQSAWNTNPNFLGHAALTVQSSGADFRGYGMGSYSNFDQGVEIHAAQAFTLAPGTGASLHDIETVFLGGTANSGIDSVANGTGGPSTGPSVGTPVMVTDYTAATADNTSTTVSCGAAAPAGTAQTCQVTVADTSANRNIPAGTVSYSADGSGSFDSSTCTLDAGTCSVRYTPSTHGTGSQAITASYQGSTGYTPSHNTTTLTIDTDATSTSVTCASPKVAHSVNCTVTVADTSNRALTPTGVVHLSTNGQGRFDPTSCTLSNGTCSIDYTPTAFGTGEQTVTATYAGDTDSAGSSSTSTVTISPDVTATKVSCHMAKDAADRRCQATVTDTTSPARTPTGTVQFAHSGMGSFKGNTSCILSHGACSVIFAAGAHSQKLTATYRGSAGFAASSKSYTLVVLDKTTTDVACARGSRAVDGYQARCRITVTDVWRAVRPSGRVRLSGSSGVSVAHSCALGHGSSRYVGTCTVTVHHAAKATLRASYPGTSSLRPSSTTVTLTKGRPATGDTYALVGIWPSLALPQARFRGSIETSSLLSLTGCAQACRDRRRGSAARVGDFLSPDRAADPHPLRGICRHVYQAPRV